MEPMLLLSCALIGLAVSLSVYAYLGRAPMTSSISTAPPPPPSGAPIFATVGAGEIGAPAPELTQPSNLHEVLLQRSRSERVVKPWINKLQQLAGGAAPTQRIESLRELAVTAGMAQTWTPARIASIRTTMLIGGIALGLLFWRLIGGLPGLLFALLLAALGWRGFDVYLVNRARTRQEAITFDLPDIADQVAINVQAGLTFEQAIRRTVDSTDGPLAEELARFLHDTRVGIPRQTAFKNLQERVDVSDMTSFVRAIAQAERSGVSITEILQIQAEELRVKRKQRAEERAMKLPVLMLVPLVTCILPPLLIVLLGPAVLQIVDSGFN